MANKEIVDLTGGTPVATDVMEFQTPPGGAGTSFKTPLSALKTFMSASPTLVTPDLGTPSAGVMTNATGTATGLTSGITNALKSATTTVNVSSATAPTNGQVLTATAATTATWQTPSGGGITVGTTAITSGTATRLLYETSGNVVGEISGATSNGTALTLVAPVLGTPASGTLTSCTGLPPAGVVGTAAILGANTFTATQTINPAVNTNAIAISGYSLTGSNTSPAIDISGTWNTPADQPILVHADITNTASVAPIFIDMRLGGTLGFQVRGDGAMTLGSGFTVKDTGFNISIDVQQYQMRSDFNFEWSSDSTYFGLKDLGVRRQTAGRLLVTDGSFGSTTPMDLALRQLYPDFTNTATVGAVTINKAAGKAIIAAGASSVVVTNSLVTANSQVLATIATNDTTAILKNVVPGSGSFTVTTTAAVTADTKVSFFVMNQ